MNANEQQTLFLPAGQVLSVVAASGASGSATRLAKLPGGGDADAENDVLIGLNAEASIDNLVAAITDAGTEGTHYGTGTTVNADVSAVKTDTDKVTATAKIKGVSGDSIAIDETLTHASWAADAKTLGGGVNGTVGVANETCADGSYLYHCIATNTIADANWRKITLGTAF